MRGPQRSQSVITACRCGCKRCDLGEHLLERPIGTRGRSPHPLKLGQLAVEAFRRHLIATGHQAIRFVGREYIQISPQFRQSPLKVLTYARGRERRAFQARCFIGKVQADNVGIEPCFHMEECQTPKQARTATGLQVREIGEADAFHERVYKSP